MGSSRSTGPFAPSTRSAFGSRGAPCSRFSGPNGAGKTTTVEILEGIRPRTSGTIRVLGRDPWVDRDRLIREVGVIPQDFSFFDKLTPVEGLEFYGSLFDRKVDAMALLRTVELEEKQPIASRSSRGARSRSWDLRSRS